MSLTKETADKKVNFEFNKEFINVFSKKIKDNDTEFLNKTLKELHPADSADIIENLIPENRSKLIELEGFNLDLFSETKFSIISAESAGWSSLRVLFKKIVSFSLIFLLKTLINSLLNSKFTFLSDISFVKLIKVLYLLNCETV